MTTIATIEQGGGYVVRFPDAELGSAWYPARADGQATTYRSLPPRDCEALATDGILVDAGQQGECSLFRLEIPNPEAKP